MFRTNPCGGEGGDVRPVPGCQGCPQMLLAFSYLPRLDRRCGSLGPWVPVGVGPLWLRHWGRRGSRGSGWSRAAKPSRGQMGGRCFCLSNEGPFSRKLTHEEN